VLDIDGSEALVVGSVPVLARWSLDPRGLQADAGGVKPEDAIVRDAEVTMHGHRITYRVAGDPNLPVVLLVHGITSSSATWAPVIPALAEHAHVIAPDLLGHGGSDKPRADYSLGALASGLRDLLERLGHDRATVVGHSLGGGVVMQFAYQFYEHCDRMVLVSSGGLGREVSVALRAATLPGAELVLPVIAHRRVRDVGVAVSRLLERLPVRLRPSVVEVARGYASLADTPTRSAFVQTLRSVVGPGGQQVSGNDRLYLAEGRPTLIVWGARDTVIPVAHAHVAHLAIPGSRLEIFEQSGHFPHQDEPIRFARVLLDFLRTTQPTALDRGALRDLLANGKRR
jgi:pimeloyl-ACP methyl ester carboxylesterase